MICALQQHPGQLRQNQNDGLGQLRGQGICGHKGGVKRFFGGRAQRTNQMGIFVCQIKVQNNCVGIFREYDMKLIMAFRGEKDNGVVGNLVGFVVDDNAPGDVSEEEKPAIIANAGFSLDTQRIFVYSGIPDMGVQIR